ncbi:MAG: hypothetical protein QM756_39085 [Polyangiaceae bacterium]
MQSATVDLFHNCGVAVAPLPRVIELVRYPEDQLTCVMRFTGAQMNGNMLLSVPPAIPKMVRYDGPTRPNPSAWIAEVSNQLLGRLKKRLSQFQIDVNLGLPVVLNSASFARHRAGAKDAIIYPFRTLAGDMLVILDGVLNYSALSYSGAVKLANEGDIILF